MREKIYKSFCIGFFCWITLSASGQLADLVRIEYTLLPAGQEGIQFSKKRILFNYPVKLKNEAFLFLGLDYSRIDLTLDQQISEFDQNEIVDFQLLDFNIGYTFQINKDWRFAARVVPGLSTNFNGKGLLFDDAAISSDILFIKDKKGDNAVAKPFRLIVGLSYSSNRGFPFPLPFISYYRKFHPKWSYNVGIPLSNFQYHWSERFRVKLFAQLDGFTSNLQQPFLVSGMTAERLRESLIIGGLRLEHKFGQRLELFVNSAYIFDNVIQIRRNSRELFELNGNNKFHFRTGIRLKI